jgi:hypothetical protein
MGRCSKSPLVVIAGRSGSGVIGTFGKRHRSFIGHRRSSGTFGNTAAVQRGGGKATCPPNKLLKQTGHARGGFARRNVSRRVSRLLSVFVRRGEFAAMSRDFLMYWKLSALDRQAKIGGVQDHAAGKQYRRTEPGDRVWLITVREDRLRLATRIVVGKAGAARLLGCKPANLWNADWHIVAAKGTEMGIVDVDIQRLARALQFNSPRGRNRLAVNDDDTITVQQLQTMRELLPASAELLAGMVPRKAP